MPKHEYGQPGLHLRRKALRRALVWIAPVLAVSISLVVVGLVRPALWVSLLCLLLIPVGPTTYRLWERRASRAIDPWIAGLEGEQSLAGALRSELGDDFYLVHGVDFGRGNVDHVVVAPAGIFTIETKADLGKVETKADKLFVNGFDREHDLKQAFAEAMAVRDYLKGISRSKEEPDGRLHWITPLLVFTRGNVSAQGKCRGVYVMSLSRLPRFIKYESQRLDAKQRSAIAAALGAKAAR